MSRLRDWPIKRKITAILLLSSGLVLLLTSAAFVTYEVVTNRETIRIQLATRSGILAATAPPRWRCERSGRHRNPSSPEIRPSYGCGGAVWPGRAGVRDLSGSCRRRSHPRRAAAGRLPLRGRPSRGVYGPWRRERTDGWGLSSSRRTRGRIGRPPALRRHRHRRPRDRDAGSVCVGGSPAGTDLGAHSRLAETATVVSSRQDYSVRAPKLGEDELGTLTDAFNQMLERIEDQDRELRRHATDLEQRVEARTHELSERNETLRRNAAELLAANQELDAFAYSVSHDLRAPLRSIDGFSQILLEDYGAQLDEAGQDSCDACAPPASGWRL